MLVDYYPPVDAEPVNSNNGTCPTNIQTGNPKHASKPSACLSFKYT